MSDCSGFACGPRGMCVCCTDRGRVGVVQFIGRGADASSGRCASSHAHTVVVGADRVRAGNARRAALTVASRKRDGATDAR